MQLVLAPIRGITDCLMRSLLQKFFGGFDEAVAPFIRPMEYTGITDKHLADILPAANPLLPIIPQLLHNKPDDFILLAKRIHNLGYERINWNLGCPAPMVTKKKRGSGLLPYPDEIRRFLDQVCGEIPQKLSIKTRLGLSRKEELYTLLPFLNDYPLAEIIIHARLGSQLYRGKANPDFFARCCTLSRHRLVYNGDINSVDDFKQLQTKFPALERWMIGRGALQNPFLATEIKSGPVEASIRMATFQQFHQKMFQTYQERLSGDSHLLGKMKQFWHYFIHSFPGKSKHLKSIKKANTKTQYFTAIEKVFHSPD